jgi:hypothetical protein
MLDKRAALPTNLSAYCSKPNAATKSAACSAVQSMTFPLGLVMSRANVGVCSVERPSDSIGDTENSVGSVGDITSLRSYSSSASESSRKVGALKEAAMAKKLGYNTRNCQEAFQRV